MIVTTPMGATSCIADSSYKPLKNPNDWASKLITLRYDYGVFDMVNPILNISLIIPKSSF